MPSKQAAREYARAITLFSADNVDVIIRLLRKVMNTRKESRDFNTFLLHPAIASQDKIELIHAMVEETVPELILRILADLVRLRNLDQLPQIIDFLVELREKRQGVQEAEVVSTDTLTEEEKDKITAAVAAFTGKKASILYKIDKDLIAGMRVKIGDRVFDNSVRRQLEIIGDSLTAVTRV